MTEQAGASAPGRVAQARWRRSASAMSGVAVAMALALSGCASSLPGGWALEQPGKPQPAPQLAPASGETVAAPRQIAVLPLSKPAGRVNVRPSAKLQAPQPAAAQLAGIAATGYLWPVQGRIARAFGAEPSGRRSDGLDISAAEGSPVLAAETGVVAYAGSEIQGYGNMLLIEHPGGLTTVYAHNRELLVHVGEMVRRGEVVATVGRSGGSTDSRLHFQLRVGNTPIDPTPYLVPGTTVLASADPGVFRGRE